MAGVFAACTGEIAGDPKSGGGTGATSGGGAGSGNGGSGGSSLPGGPRPLDLTGDPKYFRFVRLTNGQWANAVRDILKLPAPSGLEAGFASTVSGTTDFDNNELLLDVTQRTWSDYQAASETLAAQVTATDAALQRVYTGTDAAGFIQTFGRRAYRRPLTAAEVTRYQALFTTGSTMTGTQSAFTKGAALVIRAMLQSPMFIYRTEMGATGTPLTGYEMAAKLSLWLRDTVPSDALLDSAAGPGRLDTADGAVALASTMLAEPTAIAVMRKFHGGMLDFDSYATISKLNVPSYRESLNPEYEEASYLFFDKLFTEGLGVREMLTSTFGFVGAGMASLYGVAAPAPATGFVERDLGPRRVGFFSQLPFLSKHGINAEPDPIHRGVSVNLDILCANPGAALPNLPSVPELMPTQTNRERYTALTSGCGGECHNSFINPIGFAFENFDGMGQWRDMENGKPIDSAGSYPFTEGVKSFSNAAELMTMVAQGQQAHTCYGKKLASFALQRDVVASDMPLLSTLQTASMATNGSIKQVILELVRNPAFRTRVGGAP
jgi:hypothetical protein